MMLAQKHALSRALLASFTVDDAKHILNWYFGSTPIQLGLGCPMPTGVSQAIEKLGGECKWGLETTMIRVPNYQPFDEGNDYQECELI